MKIKTKKVYYCEYCGFKRLAKWAVERHENHCTMNPIRKCRVCNNNEPVRKIKKPSQAEDERLSALVGCFKQLAQELLEKLECPACTLAVLRQSGFEGWEIEFDYKKEMKDYWANQEPEYYGM